MPRNRRVSEGGLCYHVLNRSNERRTVFHNPNDYHEFVAILGPTARRHAMRLLAYCVMPNHFHLVLWPLHDNSIAPFMHRLMTTHVRRHHERYETAGRLWQGPYRSFPIESDEHLVTTVRYVERNALRANLVAAAEDWPWSSACQWRTSGATGLVVPGPVERPDSWLEWVNAPQTTAEEEALRCSIRRGAPFGHPDWQQKIAGVLGLESTLRPLGRPRRRRSNDPRQR